MKDAIDIFQKILFMATGIQLHGVNLGITKLILALITPMGYVGQRNIISQLECLKD